MGITIMKTLLTLFLILFPLICNARGIMMVGGSTPACGTLLEQDSGTTAKALGYTAANHFVYMQFTASSSGSVKTVYVYFLTDTGSPTSDITVALCPDDAGNRPVAASCVNADAVITGGEMPDAVWKKVNFAAGYAITATTKYHVRLYTAQEASGNYYNVGYLNSGTHSIGRSETGADGSWTETDGSATMRIKLSSCVE